MIQRLGETLTAGLDLLEAEGRLARLHAARFLVGVLALCAVTCVAFTGALGVLVGATWLLALEVGPPIALLIAGATIAILGGFGVWLIHRKIR